MQQAKLAGKFPGSIVLAGIIGLSACGGPATSSPDRTPAPTVPPISIQAVHKTVKKDSSVYLKGTVGDRVPLLGATAYELQDGTGKIWVLTQKPPPENNQKVFVTGTLRFRSIPINGQEQGSLYIEQN